MNIMINDKAVILTVILAVNNKASGVREPILPDPLPKEVTECLYQESASFYDYENEICKSDLTVKVESIETLKAILKGYGIPFIEEVKNHEVIV